MCLSVQGAAHYSQGHGSSRKLLAETQEKFSKETLGLLKVQSLLCLMLPRLLPLFWLPGIAGWIHPILLKCFQGLQLPEVDYRSASSRASTMSSVGLTIACVTGGAGIVTGLISLLGNYSPTRDSIDLSASLFRHEIEIEWCNFPSCREETAEKFRNAQ